MKQGSSEISSNSKKTHKQPEQLYSEPFESLTSPINLPNPVIHHVIQPPKTTDSVVQPTVLSCNEVQPSNLNGSNNTNDKICGEEFELFIGSDGKQYAELSNGTFMEITTKSESTNETDPAENHEELSAATIDLEIRNKRASKNSPGAGKNHISFETSFPEFIKFVYRVVYAADFSHTKEHNDKLFKDYLRYKNTEYKRFQEGYGDQRASSTRKRKQSKVLKANEAQEISPKRQRSSSQGSKSTSSESCDGSLTSLTS
ncbi:uncharacterized protein LOC134208175 [Armigeres subalbatus]|uniref:uncharacterized protein LOC134208175 n=1 Tax=Armigeres subalbatus TaxID=124917 RepID=UPI002ED00BDE